MSDKGFATDLLKRLRTIERGDGTGDHVTHWHRNPDGQEAAAEIERLRWADKRNKNIIGRLMAKLAAAGVQTDDR